MGTQPIGKFLLQYAIPAIIAMTASSLYNMVDSIFIGHGVGPLAISGLAITFPLMNLAAAFGSLVGVGASALVSVKLGQKDYATAQNILGNVVTLNFIIGIGFSILTLLFLDPILYFFGASPDTISYARDYMVIILLGNVITHMYLGLNALLRASGHPQKAMTATITTVIINTILDPIFIYLFHWGIQGAAIATMLSQVVGGLLPVFYFLNRKNTSLLHLCRPQFEGGVLLKACVNGSSELMTNLSMSLVNILYNYQLLRFAGEDGVAAYGVIMYASFLFVAVFVGYAVGSAPIVSYHYGANNRKEVNNLYRKSLKLIGVVAVVMTIGSMFIIPHVARFFVGYDENLLILTTRAFRLYGLSFLIMGFNVYASSFFTALGDGVTSALISFLRTLLFQVAAVLLLPLLLGIDGIWLAVTAAELAALLVSIGLFITRDQQFHYRKAE